MKAFSWTITEEEVKAYKERRMSRQYLLMVDEIGMALLSQICKGSLQFVPVDGMPLNGNPYVQLLSTPTGYKPEVGVNPPKEEEPSV